MKHLFIKAALLLGAAAAASCGNMKQIKHQPYPETVRGDVVANCMADDRIVIISTHQVHDVEQLLDHVVMVDTDGLRLDASVADLCSRYSFELRQSGSASDDVIYAEPSLQGNAVIAARREGMEETQLNLELLFNAVQQRKI